MRRPRTATWLAGAALAGVALSGLSSAARLDARGQRAPRPSLSLRASPSVGFAPARFAFTAELRGGADDYEGYYCPTVEWDWGDGTISSHTLDCVPYEAGKTTITRRYPSQHVFRVAGSYEVHVRLLRGEKPLVEAGTSIMVRPGLGGS